MVGINRRPKLRNPLQISVVLGSIGGAGVFRDSTLTPRRNGFSLFPDPVDCLLDDPRADGAQLVPLEL